MNALSLTISGAQSGVPLPERSRRPGRPRGALATALAALEVGDCVDVSEFADATRLMKRVSRYTQIWRPRRYQSRKLDHLVRVWRTR